MDQTPNTLTYMIAGYVVLIGFPILYVASWFLRRRNLEKDLEVLGALAAQEQKEK